MSNKDENDVLIVEETDEQREHRYSVLVDESDKVFSRFLTDFQNLNEKIISHFQIFLVLISIEVAIITSLHNLENFSYFELTLIVAICLFALESMLFLMYLYHPRIVKDVKIFEDERLNLLQSASSIELLSDYLTQMKKSYDHNVQIYKRKSWGSFVVFYLMIIMTFFFIIFIGFVLMGNK